MLHEHWLDVVLQEVLRHEPPDHFRVRLQRLVVRGPHLRRHLDPHVDQLAEVPVVGRILLVVAKGRGKFYGGPLEWC